jgi:ribosomal protein S19
VTKVKGGVALLVLGALALAYLEFPIFDNSPSKGNVKKVVLTVQMERQPVRIVYSLGNDNKGPFEPEGVRTWHRNVWVEPGTVITLVAVHGGFETLTCLIQIVGQESFADAQTIYQPGMVRCAVVV